MLAFPGEHHRPARPRGRRRGGFPLLATAAAAGPPGSPQPPVFGLLLLLPDGVQPAHAAGDGGGASSAGAAPARHEDRTRGWRRWRWRRRRRRPRDGTVPLRPPLPRREERTDFPITSGLIDPRRAFPRAHVEERKSALPRTAAALERFCPGSAQRADLEGAALPPPATAAAAAASPSAQTAPRGRAALPPPAAPAAAGAPSRAGAAPLCPPPPRPEGTDAPVTSGLVGPRRAFPRPHVDERMLVLPPTAASWWFRPGSTLTSSLIGRPFPPREKTLAAGTKTPATGPGRASPAAAWTPSCPGRADRHAPAGTGQKNALKKEGRWTSFQLAEEGTLFHTVCTCCCPRLAARKWHGTSGPVSEVPMPPPKAAELFGQMGHTVVII